MVDLVGKRLGQYEILSVLGQGGMAIVYKAHQESMDRDVAIKVIGGQLVDNPDFVARFQREARLIAKLQHPHILPVYDFGKEETLLFLVMRLVEGGSLDDRLRRGALPVDQAARVFTQIASALTYAHDQGIVHRDLKPNNILLDTKDNPYLTDFGIAKLMEDGGASGRITATGTVMGTPSYMAPEQWRGESVDARTDIYALGVMLYEMLTGDLPFKGDTPYALMYKHFDAQPPSPRLVKPELPEAVNKVLAKALAKDKDQRYAAADLMAQDLNAALAGRAVHADISMDNEPTFVGDAPEVPTKQGTPARKQDDRQRTAAGTTGAVAETVPASKGRLPLIAAGVAIVLLIVGGGLFLASRNSPEANFMATQVALAALPTHTATSTTTPTVKPTDKPTASPTASPTTTPTAALPTAVRFEDYSDQQLNIKFRTPAGWEVQKKESTSLFVTQDFSKLVFGTANNNPIVTGPPYMQIVVANSQALGAMAMADAKTPMEAITAYYGTEQLANLDPVYGTHFPTATTTRTKPEFGVMRYVYLLLLGPDRFALVMVQATPDQIEAINKNITLPLVRSLDFSVTPTQAVSATPTATLSGTAQFIMPTAFEKYESATHNFSLTYPSGWDLSESKGIILISSGAGISISNLDSPPYISIFTKTKAELQNYRPELSMIDIFRNELGFLAGEGSQIDGAPYPAVVGRSLGQTQIKINGWMALIQLDEDHYLEFYAQAPRGLEDAFRDKVIIPMIKSINYHPKS